MAKDSFQVFPKPSDPYLRSHSGVPPEVVSLPELQFTDTGTREQDLLDALCVKWVLVDLQLVGMGGRRGLCAYRYTSIH